MLVDFANLPLEFTNSVTAFDGIDGDFRPLRKMLVTIAVRNRGGVRRIPRKLWRWPQPIDDAERAKVIARFGQRLRRRFPPPSGSGILATLRLPTGASWDFKSTEQAFDLAGLTCSAFASLMVQNRLGETWRQWDEHLTARNLGLLDVEQPPPLAVHLDGCGIIQPARDFLREIVCRTLYGLEIRRIRECHCLRLFVATRKEQPCCSGKCAAARRQAIYRRNVRRYESNRKWNRAAKKRREQSRTATIRPQG
jgi:hypothetical protein